MRLAAETRICSSPRYSAWKVKNSLFLDCINARLPAIPTGVLVVYLRFQTVYKINLEKSMKKNAERMPRARREGLIIEELPGEVLIYDSERDRAHCLNQTAAFVWKYCDGKTTVSSMAQHLERDLNATNVDERVVAYALEQLSKDHLLEESFVPAAMLSGLTRRQMVRTLGIAAVIAVPWSLQSWCRRLTLRYRVHRPVNLARPAQPAARVSAAAVPAPEGFYSSSYSRRA
jgi:hypothetical protein